ncbi:cation:proton antiporter [Nocardia puris]|uniref:cation:proton antiporter domain-containing protein n=1 Tax=Nocardia puris TaxID=208602 RepID=UPI001894C3C1|nr:cation:proton antiporter [Nocardia puris]MBF6209654.1 cation:proton antiporter [Nocardia puris]MBF6366226.1 cation:proton antiporter [Nocardia puris]MBF6458435.1 cation:proton antiporter [Nocardia puris]
MAPDTLLRLIAAVIVIVTAARVLSWAVRRIGQPAVIGEILAGILLGPTLFGGELTRSLFPSEVRPSLTVLAEIGVVVFMFLVGLELDQKLLRGQGRIASGVALSSIVFPFALGALLALYLFQRHPTEHRLAFILFLGTAMSVTAFPVLARILTDRDLLGTPIGALAVTCAALDDVVAWTLLAVVAALVGGATGLWQIMLVVPFAVLLLFVLRPMLIRLGERRAQAGDTWVGRVGVVIAVAVGLGLSAAVTEWMGLHLIFGAFLFGAAMPREYGRRVREWALPWVWRVSSLLLLPVFFAVAGLKVDLSGVGATALGELVLILLVAIGGKGIGAYVGARVHGIPPRHSAVLATLINTRGLTELIVLTVGLGLGVLDTELYSLMVVMALVTTAMTGVVLSLIYPEHRARADREPAVDREPRPDRSGI